MTEPLASLGAIWSSALGAVATWGALRRRGAESELPSDAPMPALLLRPCAGDESGLAEALASSRVADASVRVAFLVAHAHDGAVPAAMHACASLSEVGRVGRIVVTDARGPNMKAAQLARALASEPVTPGQIVVVADSDVLLSVRAWRALLDAIRSGAADAAWVPAVETRVRSLADRASSAVLGASMHAFPLLSGLDAGGMVGKLFAVRRDALDATGGFGALTHHLGEDVELAHQLGRRGYRIRACRAVVASLASGRTWRQVLERYTRWIAVVRAQRPNLLPSYPLFLAATPLVLLLEATGGLIEGPGAVRAAIVTLAVRAWIGALARRCANLPLRLVALPTEGLMADVLLLLAFWKALVRRAVVWRGARLVVSPQGTVERAP